MKNYDIKMSKKKRTSVKPWITPGIKNLIRKRDALYRKYLCAKNPTTKNIYIFENNANNLKSTWKGVQQIIDIKSRKS